MVKAATAERIKGSHIEIQAVDVGRRIREARLERGMSLAKLGGDDLSRSFLSLVELGRSRISLRALGIVAERMELPMSFFLTDDPGTAEIVAELTLDQAEAAMGRRKPEEALRVVDQAEVPDSMLGRAALLRGWALHDLGKTREAITVLHDAIPLAMETHDRLLAIRTHYTLAMALYAGSGFEESLSHLRQALDLARIEPEDLVQVGKITVAMGHIVYMQGNVGQAVQYYQDARQIFGNLKDLENLGSVYSGLSQAYRRMDDFQNALRYSRLSLGAFEAKQNERAAAHELCNMAERYQDMGDRQQAMECAQDAIGRAQNVNAPDVEALARSRLASVYLDQEKIDDAYAEATAAEALSTSDTDLSRIYAWLVLAKIADLQGDSERTDTLYGHALDTLKGTDRNAIYADAALAYSYILRSRGSLEHALDLALQAAQAKTARTA